MTTSTGGVANLLFGHIFSRKLHANKRNWSQGVLTRPWRSLLDPPMQGDIIVNRCTLLWAVTNFSPKQFGRKRITTIQSSGKYGDYKRDTTLHVLAIKWWMPPDRMIAYWTSNDRNSPCSCHLYSVSETSGFVPILPPNHPEICTISVLHFN